MTQPPVADDVTLFPRDFAYRQVISAHLSILHARGVGCLVMQRTRGQITYWYHGDTVLPFVPFMSVFCERVFFFPLSVIDCTHLGLPDQVSVFITMILLGVGRLYDERSAGGGGECSHLLLLLGWPTECW